MNPITVKAFSEELASIFGVEKDAGLREVMQGGTQLLRRGSQLGDRAAVGGLRRLNKVPGIGPHLVNHLLTSPDPTEIGSIAKSVIGTLRH